MCVCLWSRFSDAATDERVLVTHACVCVFFAHVGLCACVCAPVGCADLMTLDTMTPHERKRQGYIHELIQTEEIYLEDLELVLEVQMSI